MIFNDNVVENAASAISQLLDQQLSTVGYDKTLVYTIVDDTNREKGQYTVSDGDVKFDAYSEDTSYKKDDSVYVVIPQGDFSAKKIIMGKYIEADEENKGVNYISPEDRIIPIYEVKSEEGFALSVNPISENLDNYGEPVKFNLKGEWPKQPEWQYVEKNLTRMIVKFNVSTTLSNYNIVSGEYGFRIYLISKKGEIKEDFEITGESIQEFLQNANKNFCDVSVLEFSSSNMIGSIYNYTGLMSQSEIYDISTLGNIIYYIPCIYHKKNFKSQTLTQIVDLESLELNKDIEITISDLQLVFGYGQEEFSQKDNLILFNHPNSSNFYTSGQEEKKTLYIYNIQYNDEIKKFKRMFLTDFQENKANEYKLDGYTDWYESSYSVEDNNRAGFGWKRIRESRDEKLEISISSQDPSKEYKVLRIIEKDTPIIPPTTMSLRPEVEEGWERSESYIESNKISFSNTDFSQNISGQVQIEILDDQKDFTTLYDNTCKIINYQDHTRVRTLKVTIPESRKYQTLQIDWYFPRGGTMLQDVKNDSNEINSIYTSYNQHSVIECYYDTLDDYYRISKKIQINENSKDLIDIYKQSFGILQYYYPSFLRNQVTCKVYYDNDMSYCDEGKIILPFGQSNSNGTVYNFGIQFENYNQPYLTYNYNNETTTSVYVNCFLKSDVVNLSEANVKTYLESEAIKIESIGDALIVERDETLNRWKISTTTKTAGILKAYLTLEDGQVLTAYLSIPLRSVSEQNESSGSIHADIQGMQGTTQISYDSQGNLLNSVLFPLRLYGECGNESTGSITITQFTEKLNTKDIISDFKEEFELGEFSENPKDLKANSFGHSDYIFKISTDLGLSPGDFIEVVAIQEIKEEEDGTERKLYPKVARKGAYTSYNVRCHGVVGQDNTFVFTNRVNGEMNLEDLKSSENYFYIYRYQQASTNSTVTGESIYKRIQFSEITNADKYFLFSQTDFEVDKTDYYFRSKKQSGIYKILKSYQGFVDSSSGQAQINFSANLPVMLPKSAWSTIGGACYVYPLQQIFSNKTLNMDIWDDCRVIESNSINITEFIKDLAKATYKPSKYLSFYGLNGSSYGVGEYVENNNQVVVSLPGSLSGGQPFFCISPTIIKESIDIPSDKSLDAIWELKRINSDKTISHLRYLDEDKIIQENYDIGDPVIKVKEDTFIQPYPIYVSETSIDDFNTFYIVTGKSSTSFIELWQQPILIQQNKYEFEILNQWEGKTNITDTSIMSPCIGAGSKNSENQFSGVLMGKIKDTSGQINHGLYGFSDGAQAFGFKEDGTAFIGKSGAGRINFDGKNGTITSLGYEKGLTLEQVQKFDSDATEGWAKTGIKIDLDDPSLDMKYKGKSLINFSPKSDTMILNSSNTYNLTDNEGKTISLPKFSLDLNDGSIKAIDFSLFAGDTSFVQGKTGRGLAINSQVNGEPPLFIGYNKNVSNLPFKYPKFQVGWNGGVNGETLGLNKINLGDAKISFEQSSSINLNQFHGEMELARIKFVCGEYEGQSYILYFNMVSAATGEDSYFFIDIRPDFNNSNGISYYESLKTNKISINDVNYYYPNIKWDALLAQNQVITNGKWTPKTIAVGDKTFEALGQDIILFTDLIEYKKNNSGEESGNCDIVSQNLAKTYFRFNASGTLGFGANLLPSSWAVDFNSTNESDMNEMTKAVVSYLAASLVGANEYSSSFILSGAKDLFSNFIDIQTEMVVDGGLFQKSGSKKAGFSVDALGITKISDLQVGKRSEIKNKDNKTIGWTLEYISLWEYIELVLKSKGLI